jgi:hypothetical protein
MRSAYKILVGKPEEERVVGTPRHRLEVNVNMSLGETSSKMMDWISLTQDSRPTAGCGEHSN